MLNNSILKSLYLLINLFSVSYPLLKSWDSRLNYYRQWPAFFKANLILLAVMIPWDVFFTKKGVWGFNPEYNLGIAILGLPLEEWMFFIFIPFACVFIYEVIRYFDASNRLENSSKKINAVVLIVSTVLLILGFGQWYTTVTLSFLILLLIYHQLAPTSSYLGHFYLSFLFMLIPFLVVNGVLTGSFIHEEVVWYNMKETFGIRLFTIPFEDIFYCMFMMLFLVTFYEKFRRTDSTKA